MIKKISFFVAVLVIAAVVYVVFQRYRVVIPDSPASDLSSIKSRGKIIALTDFNSTDYFIYKGEPMGFTYEMLDLFARHIGVGLEIITENDPAKAVMMLQTGQADILAMGLPVESVIENIQFCEPVDETRKVLVKRKPGKVPVQSRKYCEQVRDQLGLGKNTIYVQSGYMELRALSTLASSLGDTVNTLDVPYEPEKLVKYVAEGVIDFTVCDENLALVNSTYFTNIDVSTPASQKQKIAWAVREQSDTLLMEINSWIKSFKNTAEFAILYAEYFRNSRSGIIIKSDYYALNTGRISGYDEIIRKYSSRTDWDWRLVASIIYQESRFNPAVTSSAGAHGLMQIMPATAENLGINNTASPDSNIIAGLRYLDFLHRIFDNKIPDAQERIKFILASYNAGPGHVLDAMRLAEKNGEDPAIWDGTVEKWLLKKSEKEHYTDSVVAHGYFTGKESVKYVANVMNRYNHYRNMIPNVGGN